MTAILYTYPPDYLMAGMSAKVMSSRGVRVILAIDQAAPALACEFAETIRTRFDRRSNLNGREFILGHLRLMLECASGEYSLKVDSDTVIFDPTRFLAGRDESAVGIWATAMNGMQGCCYALRVADIPAMIERAEGLRPTAHLMEDRAIGDIARQVGRVHLPVWRQDPNLYSVWPGKTSLAEIVSEKAACTFIVSERYSRRDAARDMKFFIS